MNETRNLKIDFMVNRKHDHYIKKESGGKFSRSIHHRKATHKKYVYKKKNTGGYT